MAKRSRDADAGAVEKYREFHSFAPKKILSCPELEIPQTVRRLGSSKWITYRSNKIDPGTGQRPRSTFDYIHEHDAGVSTYEPGGSIEVPDRFLLDPDDDPSLVVLGKCLGFAFIEPDGTVREAKSIAPLPDLCCTQDGKCLLVIEDRSEVLVMIWGGSLGVFARGIDG